MHSVRIHGRVMEYLTTLFRVYRALLQRLIFGRSFSFLGFGGRLAGRGTVLFVLTTIVVFAAQIWVGYVEQRCFDGYASFQLFLRGQDRKHWYETQQKMFVVGNIFVLIRTLRVIRHGRILIFALGAQTVQRIVFVRAHSHFYFGINVLVLEIRQVHRIRSFV